MELIVLMPINSPKLGRIFDIGNRYDMLYILYNIFIIVHI